MNARPEPIGVILAGGLGRRIGGSKAAVKLNGRPLIHYPLDATRRALDDVAIIAKADSELPSLPGVTVWIEPDAPRHPLVGIVHALGFASGRPVLACAVDLPFVTPQLIRQIAQTDPGGAAAVVAHSAGRTQPLLGCYQPGAIDLLNAAGLGPDVPLREAVGALDPLLFEVEDPNALFNVNSLDDLLQAAAMLERNRPAPTAYPNVKS